MSEQAKDKTIDLSKINAFLLDLDGTVYLQDQLIDGAGAFIEKARASGRRCIFLTNNSSKDRKTYATRLKKLGIDAEEADVVTSGSATGHYLCTEKQHPTAFVLGTPLLKHELESMGVSVYSSEEAEKSLNHTLPLPDFAVLGFDTTLHYENLRIFCDLLYQNVAFIATHPDILCPVGKDRFIPDAGAIAECIISATQKQPTVIGKPNPRIVQMIRGQFNLQNTHLAMVGDRLYTDIALARNATILGILVLSGEATQAMVNSLDTTTMPDIIVPSLKALIPYL